MPDSLLIGLTALQTHKRAMEVTSHNLANATTPGYSRQRAELLAPTPEDYAPGQIGRGVDVNRIVRVVEGLTDERLRNAQSETNRLASLSDNLKTVELMFSEPGENGLSGVTDRLFSVLNDLSSNPESAALRSAAVQEMTTWTSTLNNLGTSLEQLRTDLKNAIADQITAVNQLTDQIAGLNQDIRRQTLLGNNANDLADRRGSLLTELAGYLETRVRNNPDGSVYVDANGTLLVGLDSNNELQATFQADNQLAILTPTGGTLRPSGGSVAAMAELYEDTLPGIIDQLDLLAVTVAKRLNAIQATGTSQAMSATTFESSWTIPVADLATDLDAASLIPEKVGDPGIPAAFTPSFTDAAGVSVARNLTINIRDTASGTANKYTLRYDPDSGNGTRSLADLVQAINTGSGGGFTVEPRDSIGVPGLSAKAVQVGAGWQLQLSTGTGQTVDFSAALDQRPSTRMWAGDAITVTTTTAIPAAIGSRIQFEVIDPGGGQMLRATVRDPADGREIVLGTIGLDPAGVTAINGIGITGSIDIDHSTGISYRTGDRFVLELNSAGAGTVTQATEATATDAGFTVRGRYQGGLGLEPAVGSPSGFTRWNMRVVTSGVIGAKQGAISPDNPPVVEFDYWTGAAGSPTLQTVRKTLDSTLPAGTPIQIAEGVYAVFDAGRLTAGGADVGFTVDAQPDQAGLLPALGVNGIFTGSTAATLTMDSHLLRNPTQLAVGTTRSEGDNSNLLTMIGVRKENLFNNGVFALDDHYTSILSDVGVRIQQANRLSENQDAIRSSLENRRAQVSGVNIDEEVGMLVMQQQAYTAAARVITFARENIQTLLDLVR